MNRRMKNIDKEVRALLMDIIRRREKAIREGEAAGDDLLGLLLESNMKESVGMSLHDVIEECKLFYIAGQETTSVLLVWTMVLLSVHSDWQARAREEVLQIFGSGKPDPDGLSHLKIVSSKLFSSFVENGTHNRSDLESSSQFYHMTHDDHSIITGCDFPILSR